MLTKKFFKRLFIILITGYVFICGWMFLYQEVLLFHPEKLEENFQFQFKNEFIERDVMTTSGNTINTLLFKQENAKGVLFYLHGNGGSLRSVGNVSEHFLPLGYDVFMLDYAGYGKSSNEIRSQQELFEDVQDVYDHLKKSYSEDKILVLGYSIGSGIGAHLASDNNPSQLILQAPYYSMVDMMQINYPVIPTFILNYRLETNKYLKDCKMPVYLFHGVEDQVIPVASSERLSKELQIPFLKLEGLGHLNMSSNPVALQN